MTCRLAYALRRQKTTVDILLMIHWKIEFVNSNFDNFDSFSESRRVSDQFPGKHVGEKMPLPLIRHGVTAKS
jgi:hypothetical protein